MKRIASYNNNYHKFRYEGAKYAKISVDIGGKTSTYVIHADAEGNFVFNTREVSAYLFAYLDDYDYRANKIDSNQSKRLVFDIGIFSDKDNRMRGELLTVDFFNGVFQRWETPFVCEGVVNLSDSKMPYWEGYPFEYSNVQGGNVERILVDDGSGELRIDNDEFRMLRTACCDGFYLKWHNGKWGYSYYLFDRIGQEKLSAKSIGTLREQFSWVDNELELGKEGGREIKLFKLVDYADRELMKSLVSSNEVYLYTGRKGHKATANDWLEVRVKGGVEETNKGNSFKQVVTLVLPKEQMRTRI